MALRVENRTCASACVALSALVAVLFKRSEAVIVQKLLQANSKIVSKEKAEFLAPTDESTKAMAAVIRENDEKGINIKIEEL